MAGFYLNENTGDQKNPSYPQKTVYFQGKAAKVVNGSGETSLKKGSAGSNPQDSSSKGGVRRNSIMEPGLEKKEREKP